MRFYKDLQQLSPSASQPRLSVSPVLNRLAVVQDLNPEVDKPGKRKKLDAGARAGSEDKDAGICICTCICICIERLGGQ